MSLESLKQRKWVIERIVNNFENYPEIGNKAWFSVDTSDTDAPRIDMQRELIEKVFSVMKAIKITGKRFSKFEKNTDDKPEENWFEIEILRPRFDELCEEYGVEFGKKVNPAELQKIQESGAGVDGNVQRLITKDGNDFLYLGNTIDFGDDTQYRDLFDIIYSNCVQSNFVSYEKIDKGLIGRGWEKVCQKKVNKRIQNALTNGIFRFAKIGDRKFENINQLNKEKLIKIKRGQGVEFNNYH